MTTLAALLARSANRKRTAERSTWFARNRERANAAQAERRERNRRRGRCHCGRWPSDGNKQCDDCLRVTRESQAKARAAAAVLVWFALWFAIGCGL